MSVRKKPEKAVTILLNQLGKVENKILDRVRVQARKDRSSLPSPGLGSSPGEGKEDPAGLAGKETKKRSDEIRKNLKLMGECMSRIKEWEKKVVKEFCEMEKTLDDAQHKSLDEVKVILSRIDGDVGKLKSSLESNEKSVTVIDGGLQPEKKQDEVGRSETVSEKLACESVSEEWASVRAEDAIVEREAERRLWASIHFPETPDLRTCLLWLSVFPENKLIKKRPLIYWWMGEGVVRDEEEGEEVLKQLLEQGFIIANSEQGSDSFILCPWARRVLIPLAQKIGLFKFSPLDQGGRAGSGERRAFLWEGGLPPPDGEHANLLTVFNINQQYLAATKLEWLQGLEKLEVLQMGRWQDSPTYAIEAAEGKHDKLLEAALASKNHLRYLSLRGISGIETLPDAAIKKLISLRILDLKACHNLERLPDTISKLRNLTHLDVSECYLLEGMPKGLHHLLNLQVLKGFVVGRGSSKIADLVKLQHLRKLSIRVRRQAGKQLGSLEKLKVLALAIFWMGDADSNTDVDPVKLPKTLTSLDLRSVPFQKLPNWLEPKDKSKLKKLCIKGGKLSDLLNYKYPSVTVLRLQSLADLQIDERDLVENHFPNYSYLEKTNCHKDHPDIILTKEAL